MTDVGAASGFRKLSENVLYEGVVISLALGTFSTPDGSEMVRDVVHHPGAVSVVPIDGDEVVLVRQFRAAPNVDLLEIPAGKRDVEGEPPELTAARELEEEIGFSAGHLELVARFYNSAGFSDEYSYVYVATDLRPVALNRQGPEEQHMTIERVPLAEVPSMIASGELADAKTIIGLQAVLARMA